MDTFSHALWARGLFGYRSRPWIALFFGAMPDLVSFGILLLIRILGGVTLNLAVDHHQLIRFPGGYLLTITFPTALSAPSYASGL